MIPPTFPFRISMANLVLLLAIIFPVRSDNPPNIILNPIDPSPTQCELFTFKWTGGSPPFFVLLYEKEVLQRSLGPATEPSLLWGSDLAAGIVLQAVVSVSGSVSAETKTFTMQDGKTSVCLPPSSSTTSSRESNTSARSTDSTIPRSSSTTPIPSSSSSSTRSSSAKQTPSPPSSTETSAPTPLSTNSQTATTGAYISTPLPQRESDSPSKATMPFSSESQPSLTVMTTSREMNSSYPSISMFAPQASTAPPEHASSESGKSGRVAGIVIGCVVAILLTALVFFLLRKHRRARKRSRITSMSTLDTLAFTATTWSDLSPPEPDKPLGANKGVTEWNADLFARDPRASPHKSQSTRASPSPWVPFTIPLSVPHAPFRRPGATARATALSTIPEAPVSAETSTSVASPVDSDDSASIAPSLSSYPPLVPQAVPAGGGVCPTPGAEQHAYPPALLPPAQVPVNPFRARLLAATSGNGNRSGSGAWARGDGYGAAREDPFR